jgi:predicted AAA+ superfamily ATPase
MITNNCFNSTDPNVGIRLNLNTTRIKCYMGDTGLLISHSLNEQVLVLNEVYKAILTDRSSINRGMLFENVIAQMLVSSGHKLFFYVEYSEESKRNEIEIDFIITKDTKIIPIEFKSSSRYQYNSLKKFKVKYKDRISESIIIHPRDLSIKEDGTICIPPYMTICL